MLYSEKSAELQANALDGLNTTRLNAKALNGLDVNSHSANDNGGVHVRGMYAVTTDKAYTGPLIFNPLSSYPMKRTDWLWPGYIAKGVQTGLHGRPEAGKGSITASLAAAITTGGLLPDNKTKAPKGRVIWLSAEDDPSRMLKARVHAAGGDPDLVMILEAKAQFINGKDTGKRVMFDLSHDLKELEKAIADFGDVQMVIFDPIASYLSGVNVNNAGDVRNALDPITAFAERAGVAVIAIAHDVKATQGYGTAASKVAGSQAFWATWHTMFVIEHTDPDDKDSERRFMCSKQKLPGGRPAALKFTTTGATVKADSLTVETHKVVWGGEIDIGAEEAMRAASNGGDNDNKPSKRDQAAVLLRTMLKDSEVPQPEIVEFAEDEGISEKTLRRAADDVGVHKWQTATGWVWSLVPKGQLAT